MVCCREGLVRVGRGGEGCCGVETVWCGSEEELRGVVGLRGVGDGRRRS